MNLLTVVLVLAGGAAGAAARYVTDHAVRTRRPGPFPWGILLVNVAGSALAGAVAAAVTTAGAPTWLLTLVATGFCGALTTFSTFSLDTIRLLEQGRTGLAGANVAANLVAGLLAAVAGWYAVVLLT